MNLLLISSKYKDTVCKLHGCWQALSQDQFWGGAGPPEIGPFGSQSKLFEPRPLTLLQNLYFVAKSGPSGRLGPPPNPSNGPGCWFESCFGSISFIPGLTIILSN